MGRHSGLLQRKNRRQTHAPLYQSTVMERETVLKAAMNLAVVRVNHISIIKSLFSLKSYTDLTLCFYSAAWYRE